MKKTVPGRLIALLLALMLAAPASGLADDAMAIDAAPEIEVAPAEETLIVVEEAPGSDEGPGAEEPPEEIGPLELMGGEMPAVEAAAEATEPESESLPEIPPEAGAAVQNAVPDQVTLGVGEQYILNATDLAPESMITYRTSKSRVATVSDKGVIKGKKKGEATISCYAYGTLMASCTVKVVAAPKKVSLGTSKLTIGLKESVQLEPSITKGSHASFSWSSKSKKTVSVSKKGVIKGKKKGKTTITVKTHNGKKAKLTVTVVGAPKKVALNRGSASLEVGDSIQLKATLPKKTASRITWTSSDESVARVSAKGKVTAVGRGEAAITARTFNGKTAVCTVAVNGQEPVPAHTPDSDVRYRALLIGQVSFSMTCERNRGDVALMEEMLNSVQGLYGGSFSITKRYDLDRAQTLEAIRSAFAGADGDDVSLFFIATHGDTNCTGDQAGWLAMVPRGSMLMRELADALLAVPGKVIVILESCGSGAAIYDEGADDKLGIYQANAQAFDEAAIRTFSAVDPGVVVELESNALASDGLRTNTGELRVENKFYVLTASRYQEESFGYEYGPGNSYNLFTRWLTDGIGTNGGMDADADHNGQVTLHELYSYISKVGDSREIYIYPSVYYQHVQVYPANSGFVLFTR